MAEAVREATTFRGAFERFWALKSPTLSNGKHTAQWGSTLAIYVYPVIGNRPVSEVTTSEIVAEIQPIWHSKPETARRVLQRVHAAFDASIALGMRQLANPTTGIKRLLGPQNGARGNHRSLPYADVPEFMTWLRRGDGRGLTTRRAIEVLVLTAARSGEVRGATWAEIDTDTALWTIPAVRIKARRAHVVPLSPRVLTMLAEMRGITGPDGLIFEGSRDGTAISDMTMTKVLRDGGWAERTVFHGFRSSFQTWAAEVAKARHEVAEIALAHSIRDATVAAYSRSIYLDERKELMAAWAEFCG